ncbi:MAG TPA: M56 family metallopeptidase [Bryobacteraceae bacterium]|nr:M56 family metallopeptidase [Bryobacteraceae bacterium]
MIPTLLVPVANHLWQSTWFTGVAGLLTLFLRKNRAHVRYWLWFMASLKFLLPFSVLVALGGLLGPHTTATVAPSRFVSAADISSFVEQVNQPFTPTVPQLAMPAVQRSYTSATAAVLIFVWAAGFMTLACRWTLRWRRMRASVRNASPLDLPIGLPVKSSPLFGEPGVFGIFRPVLLLPDKIMDCLTTREMESIVAHELCHVRRRDNLAAVIHMAVEAVFWFHPLVWWLGARLIQEREHACDEEVLLTGTDPEAYAEGILKICELYLKTPLPFVSSVTGANLSQRIEEIMSNRIGIGLSFRKKLTLVMAAISAVAAPVIVGVTTSRYSRAQTASPSTPKFEVASVKLSPDCGMGAARAAGGLRSGGVSPSPGRLHVCNTVANLIGDAYSAYADGRTNRTLIFRASGPRLEGGPPWIRSDHYLIDAKPATATTQEMMRGPMLQALLEERYHLQIRRETREVPAYALTAVRGAAKLQPYLEGSCVIQDLLTIPAPPIPPGQKKCYNGQFSPGTGRDLIFQAQGISLDRFAALIGWAVGRPVFDQTGIPGLFDFRLEFAPDEATPTLSDPASPVASSDEPAGPSIFAAIHQQFGLKLESTKGPKEYLVIDHVERPSGN